MSNQDDFAGLLRTFMARERRSPQDIAALTEIPVRTIENWRDGVVARPRNLDQVLLVAAKLPLNAGDASRLLVAAGQRPIPALITQAQRAGEEQLLELLQPWIIHMPDAQQDTAAELFERLYRKAVDEELERLDIFGVPVADIKTRRQRVSVAYVMPEVDARSIPWSRDHDDPARSIARHQRKVIDMPGEIPGANDGAAGYSGPVNRMLATAKRIVVSGEAGSGKTTLVQWIALRSAAGDFPPELAAWNDTVPFFIRLRALKSGPDQSLHFPKPKEFPDLVAQGAAGEPPQNWVVDQLKAGRAVVLVDGVDELPQAQREVMLEALKLLVRLYPNARYIITSRPLRVKEEPWEAWEAWLDTQEFARARLQDMTRSAIERFIDHWHNALLESCREGEHAQVRQMPAALKGLLRQRPALYRLASNPLLCAMICALHYDRRDNLPSERVELYRACVEMLFLRDSGRKIVLDDEFPRLKLVQQQRLIQELAYTLTRGGTLDMAREDVDQAFDYKLTFMEVPPETTGAGVRKLFTRRVRLLHEPVAGRVEFVHRTFQEYLAARAACEANEINELLNHANDDQWRETIILAAGMTNTRQSDRLLSGLLKGTGDSQSTRKPAPEKVRLRRTRRLTLAVACLETCVERSPEIAEAILEQAKTLFPPKNEEEAKLLAAAGPPAIPMLRARPWYSHQEAAACIQALALIGGDEALGPLAGYAEDDRYEVCKALGQAWDSFDRNVFAERVLRRTERLVLSSLASDQGFDRLMHLTMLDLSFAQVSDLEPLRGLTNLTSLDISFSQVSDLEPLRGLMHLTSLKLISTQVSDLEPLRGLTNLTSLDISFAQVSDLERLRGLMHLTSLDFRGTRVSDLEVLRELPNLTTLALSATQVRDLEVLRELPNLTMLYLIEMQVRDLEVLRKLPNLTTLYLYNMRVRDLEVLRELTNLTMLYLIEMQVRDLEVLRELPNLTTLYLYNMRVRDLEVLRELPNLTTLYLYNMRVRDLEVLRELPNLTTLALSTTQVRDLEVLHELPNLTVLDLSFTQVSDVEVLRRLTNLVALNINHTNISDLTPLQSLPNLRRLYIWGTKVRDLSPLKDMPDLQINPPWEE